MPENTNNQRRPNDYMKYGGWGFQLFISMYICFWLGKKVDNYFGLEKPYIALLLVFIVLVAQFYKLIKDLS